MLRGAFTGNKMEFGHYAADYVADELAGDINTPGKGPLANLADEDLELALATAIYNQNPKAVNDKKRNQEIVNTLAAAAEAQYEYMTRDSGGGSSSSSSRKSEFDKWQSGEGDNYNYMTRMESISKKQLAKIVKEELAQLKK